MLAETIAAARAEVRRTQAELTRLDRTLSLHGEDLTLVEIARAVLAADSARGLVEQATDALEDGVTAEMMEE